MWITKCPEAERGLGGCIISYEMKYYEAISFLFTNSTTNEKESGIWLDRKKEEENYKDGLV